METVNGIATDPACIRVGVMALQGAFAEHIYSLERAFEELKKDSESSSVCPRSLEVTEIRRPEQLQGLDGLILPGGESTTASKFLTKAGFQEQLKDWVRGDGTGSRFTWGTCAGLILLANNLEDMKTGGQLSIGGLDVTATRNKFGRQNESFETLLTLQNRELRGSGSETYPGVFIRAPGIKSVDRDTVEVLATFKKERKDTPAAVHQGDIMATAFHPELTDDLRWHAYFIRQVAQRKSKAAILH